MTWKNGDTEPDRLPAACFERAPPMQTRIPNVLLGSVFTRWEPVVSQEQACMNGRRAAAEVLSRAGRSHPGVLPYPTPLRTVIARLLVLALGLLLFLNHK